MKKKIILLISGVIFLVVAVVIIGGFNFFRTELKVNKVTTELGEPLSTNLSDYAKGNISDAKLDLTSVNYDKAGNYTANVTNKSKKLTFNVEVTDTIPPTGDIVQNINISTNEIIKPSELVKNIKDKSEVKITFADGEESHIYKQGGEIDEKILLTDSSGNKTELSVVLNVIADITKPVIKGVKTLTIYTGEDVNYMSGIKVVDDRDGDITEKLIVNSDNVNVNKSGKYTIIYSVKDNSGNEATKKSKIIILDDKAPIIKGTSDKTVYLNQKIDYTKGVSADDDRDGNLSSKIKVDSTKVNLKVVGTYKAVYSVTDSKGNVTNKIITVIVKKRETESSDTNKSNLKSGTDNKKKPSNNSSGGFEFFDVPPSGEDVNGDVPASGEHVGNWG